MRLSVAVLCLLATASPGSVAARAEAIQVELSDPKRPVELRVEIEWGSIRIRADAAATEVTIDSVPDRPGEIDGGLIAVSEASNVVTVRQAPLPSGSFRSANLRISVPVETNLDLQLNRGGDIRVEGIRGEAEITNLNGSVEIAGLSGAAAVNASNGAISAGFAAVNPERDMIFSSLNGSVELCLPADFSGRLNLMTAGDPIRSDFEIERETRVRTVAAGEALTEDHSQVRGRVGSGDASIQVSTLNGEIRVERCGPRERG